MPVEEAPEIFMGLDESDEFLAERGRVLLPIIDPEKVRIDKLSKYMMIGSVALWGVTCFISIVHWVSTGNEYIPWWAFLIVAGLLASKILLGANPDSYLEIETMRRVEGEIYGLIEKDLSGKFTAEERNGKR